MSNRETFSVVTGLASLSSVLESPRGPVLAPQDRGFQWPTPPFAIYSNEYGWAQPQPCDIEGINGAIRRCALVSLDPESQTALILIEHARSPIPLAFSHFRRLTLTTALEPEVAVSADRLSEGLGYRYTAEYQLHLDNGNTVSGLTVGYLETHFGLFVYTPLNDKGRVQRVFIPRQAFLSVTLNDRGPLTVDTPAALAQVSDADAAPSTELATPAQLMQALDRQSKMPMVRVGEALVRLGFVSDDQLDKALAVQRQDHAVPLGQVLVNQGVLTRRQLNTALTHKMGYPVVDVTRFPIEADALRKISMTTAKRLQVLPLLTQPSVTVVAAVDPTRRGMIEELEFLVQGRVIAALGDEKQIRQTLESLYEKYGLSHSASRSDAFPNGQHLADEATSSELLESMELSGPELDESEGDILMAQSDNTLVRLINTMIVEAFARGVSDIHVECKPRQAKVRIRFRKDGVLSPYLELPHTYRSAVVARLKIMADLDISERRKPQDGKIDFRKYSAGHRLELRIATIPTANGLEDVVMRLLSSAKPLPLDKLGLSPSNLAQLRDAVSRPYGMVLCVGPTGSGKTTSLHSVLSFLNTPERKIWTAEDPIEITQPDLRQVQVNPHIDWTFAKALRSFLRADPDVIMVGEIRDAETAHMAIEASLTGHLLLSTLHTNSAAETVTRLIDMGMNPFNFSDSLLAVLGQRLVRRLCPKCKTTAPATQAWIDELLDDYLLAFPEALREPRQDVLARWLQHYGTPLGKERAPCLLRHTATGCPECQNVGLSGRVGLHELMRVTPGLRRLIQTSASSQQVQTEAFQGGQFRTLRQDGIEKVLEGLTTIEEVRANSNA